MFILGTKVHNCSMRQAIKRAEGFLLEEKQRYIVTPNSEIVLRAARDAEYRAILNGACLSIPDGMGLVYASRILYGKKKSLKERVAGVDFMYDFLRHAHGKTPNIKVLLLGGRNGVARKSAVVLKKKLPQFDFFALENIDNKHIRFLINEMIRPDCLFAGLGSPMQEKWIHKNLQRHPTVRIAMGVGGSFDFISGRISRAPFWMRAAGIEWFWRCARQPWRIYRIFNAAIIFPLLVVREKFWRKSYPQLANRS